LDVDGTSTADASEQIIREHAALRRVAVLVARQPSPSEVFAAVTEEAGRLLGAQTTNLMRVERPDQAVIVGRMV
jgi:GAF domain-containing protein